MNRLPTKVLNNKSPWECLFYRAPDYHFLYTFGCLYFPWLRPYNKNKLEFRSRPCVFLGYSINHPGYWFLNIDTGRVFLSRHVIFSEKFFSFNSLSSSLTSALESNDSIFVLRNNSTGPCFMANNSLPPTLPLLTTQGTSCGPHATPLPTVELQPTPQNTTSTSELHSNAMLLPSMQPTPTVEC